MSRQLSRWVRIAVVILALCLVGGGLFVWGARAADKAAVQAARNYLDILARGDESDLRELSDMTITTSPAAIRRAGEMLIGASERIEVVSIGSPSSTAVGDDWLVEEGFDRAVSIPVKVRLADATRDLVVTLARLPGTNGRAVGDWMVLDAQLPTLDWGRVDWPQTDPHKYVSGMLQLAGPNADGTDILQPLYPARYPVQKQLEPWFVTGEKDVIVLNGNITVPTLAFEPTERTVQRINRKVLETAAMCADVPMPGGFCDATGLFDPSAGHQLGRWWLGFAKPPTMTFKDGEVTLTGGVARLMGRDGVQRVAVRGTADVGLDSNTETPEVFSVRLVPAR